MSYKQIITLVVGSISMVSVIIGAFLAVDARYVTRVEYASGVEKVHATIIDELRREIVTNRATMLELLMRERDEIEWQISLLESENKPVPRYLVDSVKRIDRSLTRIAP